MSKRVAILSVCCFVLVSATEQSPDGPKEFRPNPARRYLTLSFVGDLMAHRENIAGVPYERAFSLISPHLERADLSFANLEFVVDPTRLPAGYPNFNAPVSYVAAAVEAGIDVVSLANNHSGDLGVPGVLQSIISMERLGRTYGIRYSGIVADPAKRFEVSVWRHEGLRIGFLAVTSFLNRGVRTRHVNIASFLSPAEREGLLEVVRSVRDDVDLLILSYHGGLEYATEPVPVRVEFFKRLVDAGVDVVWGHHSHVLQRWELHRGDERTGFIMYSLGNFLSGQPYHVDPRKPYEERALTGESVILELTMAYRVDPSAGREAVTASSPEIVRIDAVPIIHLPDATGFVRVIPADRIGAIGLSPDRRSFGRTRRRRIELFAQHHLSIPLLP